MRNLIHLFNTKAARPKRYGLPVVLLAIVAGSIGCNVDRNNGDQARSSGSDLSQIAGLRNNHLAGIQEAEPLISYPADPASASGRHHSGPELHPAQESGLLRQPAVRQMRRY